MDREIEELIKLAGLKEHWHDKLKVALGEEDPQSPEITKTTHSHWLDKLKSAAGAEWYDKATQEMVDRIHAGEFEMEVVNDLARQYASMHGGSHDAFQFASDALGRRAWQMGLSRANDDDQPRYQLNPHKETLEEYHLDHMQNPGRRESEKCLDLHRQSHQEGAYGVAARNRLEDEMKKHGFDDLDLFLKTCERVVKQDATLKDELSPAKAREALMLWRKNRIFELIDFVEGYGFTSVQDLLDHVRTIKNESLTEDSEQERLKQAASELSNLWSDDRFRGNWSDAVRAISKEFKVNADDLQKAYDGVVFPLKGKPKDPSPEVAKTVAAKWNEYKEKYFNKENQWRWEELNKIAQEHNYWNLTDFLKAVAKVSGEKMVAINEDYARTVEPTTGTALAYLKQYQNWVEDPDSVKPKEKGQYEFCMHRAMRSHGYQDPNAFAQACKNKLAKSKDPKVQKMYQESQKDLDEVGDIRPNLMMSGEYGPRKGLEGPFVMKNGRTFYYDPKEGKYWDPKTDMYIPNEEVYKMHEDSEAVSAVSERSITVLRDMLESLEESDHVEEADVVPMHSKAPSGMEVPKGFDSFYVKEVSPTVGKIIGVKPDGSHVMISTTSLEGAHALAKHYNSGGRGGVQQVSLMSVFGTPVMQALDAKGHKMAEKPDYLDYVVKSKQYHIPASAIRELEKSMNMKIPVKPMREVIKPYIDGQFYSAGERINKDLETVIAIHPGMRDTSWGAKHDQWIIPPGSAFLADRGGNNRSYRMWALIPDYSATVLPLKK
jgi:hypothetical protein